MTVDISVAPSAIKSQGYYFSPGSAVIEEARLDVGFSEFAENWFDLPADPYITDREPYRFRRHSRVVFDPPTGRMTVLPPGTYVQAASENHLFGGMLRKFAPIDWTASTENFLRSLVVLNVERLLRLSGSTLVNLHMVRIVGASGRIGEPAPEGPHRDGFDYISIHLIDRDLDAGGETSLLTDGEEPIAEVTLQEPMDSVLVDDRRLRHYTSPIVAHGRPSIRDVLLMSFERAV